MKPFRRNVAIAIDGGGIRGATVARALAILEDKLGCSLHQVTRLTAGTSTGSILAAGIAQGLTGETLHRLYLEMADIVFPRTWRSALWPLTKYRYASAPLSSALASVLGTGGLGDFWSATPATDVVITLFDLLQNRTRFAKPWKDEYAQWPIVEAVLASSSVPTVFPPVAGCYVDGGVGSYANPSYLAAYEAYFCLGWDPNETTLLSLGTGRAPALLKSGQPARWWPWQWLTPVLGAFQQSADDQQVRLVRTFFPSLDFRRFQVDLREAIAMDDTNQMDLLTAYGDELGNKILNDETDPAVDLAVRRAPR